VRCARSNGFPVVMLHATPDNDDGCEFSRFFGDCSDILPHPWHTRTFRSLPLLTSDAALTLPLVSCAAPNLRLRVRARPAETTPQVLISDGLYNALALAWYTDPFRQVSSNLVS